MADIERSAHLRAGLVGPHQRLYQGMPETGDRDQLVLNLFHHWVEHLAAMLPEVADLMADGVRYRNEEANRYLREMRRG